jgi:hypothetical protein
MRNRFLESRMTRKCHVRFGGGPTEKVRQRNLVGGLPYALWHTGDRNASDRDRLALFPYFGRYWVKRMDNYFTQPLPADLLATTDAMKRQLLGLGLRPGVPSYHGDDEGYNRGRGEPGIDYPIDD